MKSWFRGGRNLRTEALNTGRVSRSYRFLRGHNLTVTPPSKPMQTHFDYSALVVPLIYNTPPSSAEASRFGPYDLFSPFIE
jgi:hypothetical protein